MTKKQTVPYGRWLDKVDETAREQFGFTLDEIKPFPYAQYTDDMPIYLVIISALERQGREGNKMSVRNFYGGVYSLYLPIVERESQ